ncbi:transposase [Chloroflexi bacterium TSY]|nr:transposase [Chloroflexi bacterium TSY]
MTPKSLQSRLKIAKNAKFGSTETLVSALLEPINEWEIPIKGIISDAQENIQLAVAQVWPNCPHQTCQFHCIKEAGRLTYALDRTMKTQLKKEAAWLFESGLQNGSRIGGNRSLQSSSFAIYSLSAVHFIDKRIGSF